MHKTLHFLLDRTFKKNFCDSPLPKPYLQWKGGQPFPRGTPHSLQPHPLVFSVNAHSDSNTGEQCASATLLSLIVRMTTKDLQHYLITLHLASYKYIVHLLLGT